MRRRFINAPGDNVLTDLPLKLTFPLVRVSRDDPDEKVFVRMLLFGNKKLLESTEPIVVPVLAARQGTVSGLERR